MSKGETRDLPSKRAINTLVVGEGLGSVDTGPFELHFAPVVETAVLEV